MDYVKKVNTVLVSLFNNALKLEEKVLQSTAGNDLSITEIHTLSAVGPGRGKTMSQVAASLSINVSTLTVAINKLVKKEYVTRFRVPEDGRIVKVQLTDRGKTVVREHEAFHITMVTEALSRIPEEETEAFLDCIKKMNKYLITRNNQR